jgi:hypothetical protein
MLLEEKKVGVASEAGGADVKTLLAMVKAAKAPVAAFWRFTPTGFLLPGGESVMDPFNTRQEKRRIHNRSRAHEKMS